VIFREKPVSLSQAGREKLKASHQALLALLKKEEPVYGVNTGFGALSRVRVPKEDLSQLQLNLVRSHAAGVGEPLPDRVVRAVLLFRANSFLQGASGVRPEIVDLLLGMLNRGVYPVIPSQGSVGASGDLGPLAHLALVLIGEGKARLRWGGAFRRRGSAPGWPHPAFRISPKGRPCAFERDIGDARPPFLRLGFGKARVFRSFGRSRPNFSGPARKNPAPRPSNPCPPPPSRTAKNRGNNAKPPFGK
jgi:hypothetical protein